MLSLGLVILPACFVLRNNQSCSMHAFNKNRFRSTQPPKRPRYVLAVASKIKRLCECLLVSLYPILSVDSLSILTIITVKYILVIMPRLSCLSVSLYLTYFQLLLLYLFFPNLNILTVSHSLKQCSKKFQDEVIQTLQ